MSRPRDPLAIFGRGDAGRSRADAVFQPTPASAWSVHGQHDDALARVAGRRRRPDAAATDLRVQG
jgi:hypothetical protein